MILLRRKGTSWQRACGLTRMMRAIELEAQEYGMKAYNVIEYNTSGLFAYHDAVVCNQKA
jgi:putative transposase